jgi:hypothetical protein
VTAANRCNYAAKWLITIVLIAKDVDRSIASEIDTLNTYQLEVLPAISMECLEEPAFALLSCYIGGRIAESLQLQGSETWPCASAQPAAVL